MPEDRAWPLERAVRSHTARCEPWYFGGVANEQPSAEASEYSQGIWFVLRDPVVDDIALASVFVAGNDPLWDSIFVSTQKDNFLHASMSPWS